MVRAEMDASALPRRTYGNSIVATDGSFLWRAIPKNASVSLQALLEPRGRRMRELAHPASLHHWALQAELPEWSFAVVRNPADRVVSAWRSKLRRPSDGQSHILSQNPGLTVGMELEDFVDWLSITVPNSSAPDAHWCPQSHFVCNKVGHSVVTFIARFEQLSDDLRAITDRLGEVGELPWLGRTGSAVAEAELSARALALIRQIYAEDYERFQYA